MKKHTISLTATVLLLALSSAWALTYDQSVNANGPAPINGNAPGVYFGSGNGNGGFTVDTENNIELGLRAHVRFPTPLNVFNSGGNGTYSFSDQNGYGSAPANRSSWNYDFSINVNQNGLGAATLASYTFWIAIDSDPSAGQSFSMYNPLLIPDNGPTASTTIAMNSENARFAIVGIPGYDNTIAGTYDIILTALDANGNIAAQTFERINVNGGTTAGPLTSVPDSASTLLLLGAGLSGFAFLRRKIAA